ncbi:MAG: hypothetical protein OEX22_10330 [Cyclobacteriaceae bacterium]|nr:hypothetical protein [Cyclobacteriaceae bacterium]
MKKYNYFLYFSIIVLFLSSCGGKESNSKDTEEMKETSEKITNEEIVDFDNMSCDDFLVGYQKFADGLKALEEKYKGIEKNDYASALKANNEMMEMMQENGEWMKTSAEFMIKCAHDEDFVEKIKQIQENATTH